MILKGSGPVLRSNPIFLLFLGGGGPEPLSPRDVRTFDTLLIAILNHVMLNGRESEAQASK